MNSLHERLVSAIKSRIIRWEYPPGYRVLEQDICAEYRVSRSPAREALRTLEADGFLRKMPKKGYLVLQPDPKMSREMYEVRLALELFVVEQLTRAGISEERLRSQREAWSTKESWINRSVEEFAELDRNFHESLADLYGNQSLLDQLKSIDERLHAFRVIEFSNLETKESTRLQHLDIISAIAARDILAARDAVQINIEAAIEHVEATIKEALAHSYLESNGGSSWRTAGNDEPTQ